MATLAVGVGRWADGIGRYDLWLPVLVVLSFILVRTIAQRRITWRSAIGAVAGGTLWSWAIDASGPIEASALAVLVAFAAGVAIRRLDAHRRRPA